MKEKLLNLKRLRGLMLLAVMCVFGAETAWGDEVVSYTLSPASGSNNSYTGNCDITINGITWNLVGNSQQIPWRLGGKSLSEVDRTVYSKTSISDNVSKIKVTHGAANSITINSWTVIVSKNDDFSDPISTLTPTFTANETTTITRPEGVDWSSCYFKFIYNVSVSGNSNRFLEFTKAEFYKETGTSLSESDLSLSQSSLSFDLYNDNNAKTITCSTSSTGAITVSGGTGYVTTSVSGNTITVTPVAATSEVQTIKVSQAADNTYAAGEATFTVSVENSAPKYTVTYKANGGTGDDVKVEYYEGEDVTVAACSFIKSGYIFTEWNTNAGGTGTNYMPDATIENITADIDLYAQWKESNEVVDVLNYDFTGISGTAYAEWNDKTGNSGAVYAGQSGGTNSSIQLRTDNSNSGIITTKSGGLVKKVSVTWNDQTADTRTLNVYGKSSAYTDATDLYNSNQGTLIGTIVKGTTTELTITDEYEFIGIRSASKAMYLDEVRITWEPFTIVATPVISGTENFLISTEVTITCATDGATIQYSTDNGNTWTTYSEPFTITATTTVKAKATKSDMDDSEVATMTFTKVTPMTVTEALAVIEALEDNGKTDFMYTTGTITDIDNVELEQYFNATYTISDGTNDLLVFRGFYLDKANFASEDQIQVGDKVVIYGKLQKFVKDGATIPEIASGNYIVSQAVPVTISAAGAVSFSSQKALDFTNSGLTANIITGKNGNYFTSQQVTVVPAETGLVIEGAEGTYNIPVAAAAADFDDVEDNLLVSTASEAYPVTSDDYGFVYGLAKSKDSGKVGFQKKKVDFTFGIGKSYLRLPATSGAKGVEFIYLNEVVTGIKTIGNEQMNGDRYNLNGQRVDKNYKGVVIVNGKKMINK